jgi:phosphate transport system permease protein
MRKIKELIIEKSLLTSALITIAVTIGIVLVLAIEAVQFFSEVSILEFLTDTQWTPLFTDKHYGILPLLSGTLLTSFIAIVVALPIGLSISIYLSEYAPKSFRKTVKPLLELLAAVPTVVYGFFCFNSSHSFFTTNNTRSIRF